MTRTQACNLARALLLRLDAGHSTDGGDVRDAKSPTTASEQRSVVAGAGQLAQLLHAVCGLQRAHRARLGAHHERVRAGTAVLVADAAQQVDVGDTGRREERGVPTDEIVQQQHTVEVVAGVDRAPAPSVAAWPRLALELTAQALEGGGGEPALRPPADAPQQVNA